MTPEPRCPRERQCAPTGTPALAPRGSGRDLASPTVPATGPAARKRAGFTLIEVLAATFLTGIVIAIAVAFQVQLGDATTRARELIRTQRRAVTILDRVARDLQGAYLLVKPDDLDPLDHPWLFLGERLGGEGEGADAVKFVTRNFRSHTLDGPNSDVATLAYFLRKPKDEPGYQLMRWLIPRLSDELDRDFPPEDDPDAMLVADGIESFSFMFISETGEELGEWDSSQLEQSGQLPLAVRVEIAMVPQNRVGTGESDDDLDLDEFRDEPDEQAGDRFERVVLLPMRPVNLDILEEKAAGAEQRFAGELPDDTTDDADDSDEDDKSEDECIEGTISVCMDSNWELISQIFPTKEEAYQAIGASPGDCLDDFIDDATVASFCL